MRGLNSLIIAAVTFIGIAILGVGGAAIVTGTVFCDQCKDGHLSLLDYPLSGMKVTMVCPGNAAGQMSSVREVTTNMMGIYVISFERTPDLCNCYTQISPNTNMPGSTECRASSGPPESVKLLFNLFGMEMYFVDPLISQPSQPMSLCPNIPNHPPLVSSNPPPSAPSPPVIQSPPVNPVTPLTPPATLKAPTPAFRLPPLPFLEATACSHEYWLKPEYRCYWRAVNPELPVALVFGPLAGRKYGSEMTLWRGLQGRGDPYMTLLREAITSLLNSYNSFHFSYNALQVLANFNSALVGPTRTVLLTALRFRRANSGYGRIPCRFTPCK